MTTPIPVFVNKHGGTAQARARTLPADLAKAFAAAGLDIDLHLIEGKAMAKAVAKAAAEVAGRGGIVAVGGGDGTIGCAAGAIVGAGKAAAGAKTATLAILPLGTRNHLARELGLPMDIAAVAKLIAAGTRRAIDVGTVGGHYFVNNASIGFYPEMVRRRKAEQAARGLPKWLANLPAAWGVLKRARHHRLRLRIGEGEGEQLLRTPLLFVGNNHYALEPGHVGQRASLEAGLLSVYAVDKSNAPAMIGFALRTLVGRADLEHDFAAIGDTATLEVRLHNHSVDVALDGEVVRLAGPLRFASLPRALSLIAPPPG